MENINMGIVSTVSKNIDFAIVKIEEINKYMLENTEKEPEKDIDIYCFKPYECPYWPYCSRHLPENNIFDIRIMHKDKKFELYKRGIINFEDVVNENINQKYLEQVIFEVNNKPPKIEKEKIKEFMGQLTYPLYFLDFETFQLAIPEQTHICKYHFSIRFIIWMI